MFIPFTVSAGAFSVLNALVSVQCWYTSKRRILLFTGGINSLIGGAAVLTYHDDPKLANLYVAVASWSAFAQFSLHGMRSPQLHRPSGLNSLYILWTFALLYYGFQRARWVYDLRYD